jgi:hypothetical protein
MKKSNVLNGEVDTAAVKTKLDKATALLNCSPLDEYYKILGLRERADWLKKNGVDVCEDTLKEAILRDHKVVKPLSNLTGKYVITWGELKPIIDTYKYEYYLNVEYIEEKIIGVKRVDNYLSDDDGVYYRFSAALINFLEEEYVKDENSEFQFSFATIDNSAERAVVIQVNGNPGSEQSANVTPYFDYSTDPKKKNQNPILNIPL